VKIKNSAAAIAMALMIGNAQATLFDRGGGLIYDNTLNITWLQDANYAQTSGYDTDGKMDWIAAKTWAADLKHGGYDDWRLAANTPVGTYWNMEHSFAGSTDVGYNITSPHSEMSHMYYVNLGLKGYYSHGGYYNKNSDFGVFRNGTTGGQTNVGLVKNLQSGYYWSGTLFAGNSLTEAWYFNTALGEQYEHYQNFGFYAWAVRDGDVAAPIPEPETYALMLAGLGIMGGIAQRRKKTSKMKTLPA
jgi:hypothetical protein